MKIGFGRQDITPRVGVELCGFGPFISRHSIGIRDRLFARAMAVEAGERRIVVVSCDLPGTRPRITARVREIVGAETGLDAGAVLVHSTHTHSGPNTMDLIGWGEADPPYLELLPKRIAQACIDAVKALRPATLSHAEVPCVGIGQNREYDRDGLPIEEVMRPGWRPNKPELQGLRFGPLALLGSPFEVFQAIRNEVVAASRTRIPLVMGFCNAAVGYATDRTAAARGGYAQDVCPLMNAQLPYADVHGDLVAGLAALDEMLTPAAARA